MNQEAWWILRDALASEDSVSWGCLGITQVPTNESWPPGLEGKPLHMKWIKEGRLFSTGWFRLLLSQALNPALLAQSTHWGQESSLQWHVTTPLCSAAALVPSSVASFCDGSGWFIPAALVCFESSAKWDTKWKVKVLLAQSCCTLCNPMDCSSPGKNTGVGCHALLQRILPEPGIEPGSPAFAGRFFTVWATREAPWITKAVSC